MAEATAQKPRGLKVDPWLLLCALGLAAVGLVMVYSASTALSAKRFDGDSVHYFRQQAVNLALGLMGMAVLAWVDYHRLRKLSYPFLVAAFIALLLVIVPGVGHEAGGSTRWLRLFGFSLQPSEIAKLALVIYLAYSLSEQKEQVADFKRGFLPHMGITLALVAPIMLQTDLGMSVTLFMLAVVMLYVAGTRLTYLVGLAALAAPALYAVVVMMPSRFSRILAYLDPWADAQGKGFQIIHSFMAFGSGGFLGEGLGASMQKLFYLPEPHTDFILAVLGEELGLVGVVLVLSLFMALIWRGINTALAARDLMGTYLALGVTLIIGLQAFVNAGVVMGLLPTKGLTLPFISYGGSSMLVNLACVGLLLSVSARSTGRAAA